MDDVSVGGVPTHVGGGVLCRKVAGSGVLPPFTLM
jgi:hypothetical protein